ncbi:ferredoxin [Rhodococcus coprophilus]|uniref:Ferredoxin n=1 Tax=Rhodococcus coprophilus TaxID=38310 RepID=A0A2X4WUV7_9NOCA|nr:ferredoxin [Rhodococcus coprophilus]MBM7457958.1 ferredoxin [Rhodococcus coprophilus]SQI30785.1 3Fe-4S ferredoxin [Rhodococcus coprophilus]
MTGPSKGLHIDRDMCEAHALCIEIAPEIFDLADDDIATCDESPPEALWPKALAAASACPRAAVVIHEDSSAAPVSSPKGQ